MTNGTQQPRKIPMTLALAPGHVSAEAAELSDKLRRMLIIASKRHPTATITVFQGAIDALKGEVGLEEWEE